MPVQTDSKEMPFNSIFTCYFMLVNRMTDHELGLVV